MTPGVRLARGDACPCPATTQSIPRLGRAETQADGAPGSGARAACGGATNSSPEKQHLDSVGKKSDGQRGAHQLAATLATEVSLSSVQMQLSDLRALPPSIDTTRAPSEDRAARWDMHLGCVRAPSPRPSSVLLAMHAECACPCPHPCSPNRRAEDFSLWAFWSERVALVTTHDCGGDCGPAGPTP